MSDLEESAREIDRHTSRQRRLRQQVADLRLQLSEAKQSETKHKRKVNELKQQYEESQISRERLAEQLEQTQNHLVKRENEIQSIEDTLHRSETTCSKLTGELDKALNKVDTLQRSNKHFIELNRRSEAGVTSREVKARKNYEKALEMIRKYKSHLQSVEGELAQCQENHSDLKV
jgi:chromosome segregation ATPase